MRINGHKVLLSTEANEIWISFGVYRGTLAQLIAFRKSFDYECYRFGNGYFNLAKWKTIIADNHQHQGYPLEVGLCNTSGAMSISWDDLEALMVMAREYAAAM